MPDKRTPEQRLWEKVDKREPQECWPWLAAKDRGGYGQVRWNGAIARAPRVVYELVVGPIPDGLDLDHLCRNRICVNPDHLEPVTRRTNVLRGETITAQNARKTHCPQGHEYTAENTFWAPRSGRECATCKRKRTKEYRARSRLAGSGSTGEV